MCWMGLNDCELNYTANAGQGREIAGFWEKKLTASQRRYLRAVETLARVRKLAKSERNPAFDALLRQQLSTKWK